MFLAIISTYKWVVTNWRIIAIAAILGGAFYTGWASRGYIAEAAQNKAIAAAVAETKQQEKKLYDEALQREKRKRAIREKARANNAAIYSAPDSGDGCGDKLIPDSWMRIFQDAYGNGTGK